MTKVGAYCIIRIFTLIFGDHAGAEAWIAADWLLPAALVTLVVGSIGPLGAKGRPRLIYFSEIASMGTLLTALAQSPPSAKPAALFYLITLDLDAAAISLLTNPIAAPAWRVRPP